MELYAFFFDIHEDFYVYYKKSDIDLAFKNLENSKPATLRQYNALNDEVCFENEYSSDRYFRKFKDITWFNLDELKERIQVATDMREQLVKGDFD